MLNLLPLKTFYANKGYNFISMNTILPKDGVAIAWVSKGGSIAYEKSNKYQSDYSLYGSILNGFAFYVKIYITKPLVASLFHNYSAIGFYNLSITVGKMKNGSNINLISNITIDDIITDLKIIPTVCLLNEKCYLNSSVKSGKLIDYYWNLTNLTYSTHKTDKNIIYTFYEIGKYPITLYANNKISNSTYHYDLYVCDYLTKFFFKSISAYTNVSASIVNKPGLFTFKYSTGGCYSCLINFGNNITRVFTDEIKNYNNSLFDHIYTRVGTYRVKMNCAGKLNSIFLEFDHLVQEEIKNLKMMSNLIAYPNKPFNIFFSISDGTSPKLELFFINSLDVYATFNYNNSYVNNNNSNFSTEYLTGQSSMFKISISNLYPFNLTVFNQVCVLNKLENNLI
jgi:hypothetical protein